MPRPPTDLGAKVLEILDHVEPMPGEAESPFRHYEFGSGAAMNMRRYLIRILERTRHHPGVRDTHFATLNNMVLVNLVEAFERFIKEIAAVCVDHLCRRTFDSRFDDLSVSGGYFVAHFGDSSAGRALCESETWLNCGSINQRFNKFLRLPSLPNTAFHLFDPKGDTIRVVNVIWQLRHSIVHNVGVLTRSDAVKLRILARKEIGSPRRFVSTVGDLKFLKTYLDQQVEEINQRVGDQLARILTELHADDPSLFVPQEEADLLARKFRRPVTIAGGVGVVPP